MHPSDFIGSIAAIAMVFGYLPQTVRTVRTRSTDDLATGTFLMMGFGSACFAVQGLVDIVNEAGANLEGIGIAVEKGFQGGGDRFRASGIPYKALAVIEKADENGFVFREE